MQNGSFNLSPVKTCEAHLTSWKKTHGLSFELKDLSTRVPNERVQVWSSASFTSSEDKWVGSAGINPHYLPRRRFCCAAGRPFLHQNPTCVRPPAPHYQHKTPRRLSANAAPPEDRELRTRPLWSELRSAWLTIRGQTATRSPPLITAFLKLSSSDRCFSVLCVARGLALNISVFSPRFPDSHTNWKGQKCGWKGRDLKKQFHICSDSLCVSLDPKH